MGRRRKDGTPGKTKENLRKATLEIIWCAACGADPPCDLPLPLLRWVKCRHCGAYAWEAIEPRSERVAAMAPATVP